MQNNNKKIIIKINISLTLKMIIRSVPNFENKSRDLTYFLI